jgi:hypothetical protein
MSRRRAIAPVLASIILAASYLAVPAPADHLRTTGSVSAQVKELRGTDYWSVDIPWTAACTGAKPGTAWYGGALHMIDVDTGERHYVGGVVNTSGAASVSETREWAVSAIDRPQTLVPELTVGCYENFPLHGGPDIVATGAAILIPARLSGRRGGGGGGTGGGDGGGRNDPTRALGADGCRAAVIGTNGPDRLDGGQAGDVMVGFAAGDRLRGRAGHDCLIGGSGRDRLEGEEGDDRLTGGPGGDRLTDDKGTNAFDAGPGGDLVDARNGARETVRCGPGHDLVRADRRDRLRGCERRLR